MEMCAAWLRCKREASPQLAVPKLAALMAETARAFVLRAINEATDYPSVMISVMSYVRNSALGFNRPYLHARCLHVASCDIATEESRESTSNTWIVAFATAMASSLPVAAQWTYEPTGRRSLAGWRSNRQRGRRRVKAKVHSQSASVYRRRLATVGVWGCGLSGGGSTPS